jgi:GreA/GreB family transcription elongation factor
MSDLPSIYLTRTDLDRLNDLVEAYAVGSGGRRLISCEEFEEETTAERRDVTLVYPGSGDINAGRISILAPVGTALLGLRVGQSIDWELPSGQKRRYRIIEVPYQPEAAGKSD